MLVLNKMQNLTEIYVVPFDLNPIALTLIGRNEAIIALIFSIMV